MDDTQNPKSQIPSFNAQIPNSSGQVTHPQQDDSGQVAHQPLQNVQQPIQSVGLGTKEHAPMPTLSPVEVVTPSTPEMHIPQELKEHMEAAPVVPTIPQAVQQAGVAHAKEATPISISPDEPLGINTSPSVLIAVKKAHGSIKESIRWLAELIGLAQRKRDHEIMKGGKE